MMYLPATQWIPAQADDTCGSLCRASAHLTQVIHQFDLTSTRYLAVNGLDGMQTWCNIFVWDCTKALSCEIPHWRGEQELTANEAIKWLKMLGAKYGWVEKEELEIKNESAVGLPCIITYDGGAKEHGHMAMVLPYSGQGELQIAQAGVSNFFGGNLSRGFGDLPVQFFAHS